MKLPPSGKITNASFSSRFRASSPICCSRTSPADPPLGCGEMNRLGTRLRSTSIAGSQARVSLSTTRGSRPYQCISAYITVNESPGPACRSRPAAGGRGRRRGGTLGDDLEPQHPAGLAEEHDQVGLRDVVVDPLEERPPDEVAEAGGDPQAEQLDQHHGLQHQVQQHQPEQPQRPEPAGHQRGEQRRAEHPQRHGGQQQRGQRDHRRSHHRPAQDRGHGVCSFRYTFVAS